MIFRKIEESYQPCLISYGYFQDIEIDSEGTSIEYKVVTIGTYSTSTIIAKNK